MQLTDDGSASPDKLPLAGGSMTGALIMDDADITPQGTSLIKLLNAIALQGRDAGNADWRDLIGVDATDIVNVGDVLLAGGMRPQRVRNR